MLRVYSILYLQQVWERPISKSAITEEAVIIHESEDATTSSTTIKQFVTIDDKEEEEGLFYGTVNIVSSTTPTSSRSNSEQSLFAVHERKEDKENHLLVTFDELSCSNSSFNTTSNGKANSLLSIPVLPPSRSETPSTQHQEEFLSSAKNSVLVLNNSKIEREYYEDDISSDTDEQEEEEEEEITYVNTIPSPPPTPSNKFSPKRILHRAKSSINEESVKKIGRRTSLFLEKFNQLHQHQEQQSSVSPLPPINVTPQNAKNSNIKEDFSKGLRRQSSKLTVKGKTLTRKIKRVLSFHQTGAATATA